MKKYLLIIPFVIFLSFTGLTQRITGPTWNLDNVYIETAKIAKFNPVLKKYENEKYKTSSISITEANSSNPTLTLDIPDIFYIKDADFYSIEYKVGKDELEHVTYYFLKDKTLVSTTFYFGGSEYQVDKIIITLNDNYNSKVKGILYLLTEVK